MIRFLGKLADWFALAGGLVLLVIVAVTTTNTSAFMLDRVTDLFGVSVSGLPGYEDFVRLAISAAGLMFLPICQSRRGHVAVDLFIQAFPRAVQDWADRTWLVLTAGVAGFLGYWMVFGLLEKKDDSAITAVLGWHEWPFYIPGILSVALWGAIALAQAVKGGTYAES